MSVECKLLICDYQCLDASIVSDNVIDLFNMKTEIIRFYSPRKKLIDVHKV